MKKIRLLLLLALSLVLSLMIVACIGDGPEEEKILDFEGLSFESAEYTYDGTPKSLAVKGVPITADVSYSQNALTNAGVYEIVATVSKSGYNTKTMSATLTINKSTFGVSLSDKTVTYDGKAHAVVINGTLPEGITVKYQGNVQSKAGEHTVTAIFDGVTDPANYVTSLTATLKINKAVYDMSGVAFSDDMAFYDGTHKSLAVTGALPEGVSVSYEGGGTQVGTYGVTAKFTGDSENYEPIPDMHATVTVLDSSAEVCRVRLFINDTAGVTVTGDSEKSVPKGGRAVFKLGLKSTYGFVSTSHGTYNEEAGELVVDNVQSNITVAFTVRELGYDKNDTVRVKFDLYGGDTSSAISGAKLNLGSEVTLTAGDSSRNFIGWSLGYPLSDGGTLLSLDKVFILELIPEVIGDRPTFVTVYSNYREINILTYNPNGGTVNTESTNMKGNEYYTAVYEDGVVNVTLSDKYMSFAESASSFWDDGTFTREGYVLLEYNTKPDGTGEPYSLGSKFYTASTTEQTLYCIWREASPASDFEYESVKWGYASGIDEKIAPHWKVDGIKITKYNGDDEWVVIPETIDGKYVTTIDKDAFVDKSVKVLVFNKYIIRVEDGAFRGCSDLTTLYMNDGICYINDAAFDAATYTSFKHFYLNATMAPRFMSNGHGDGGVFSVKLSRLLASQDKNRIIIVSGSSTYQGLGSAYLEGLLDHEYTVINLGTTRTGTGMIFFEALQHYIHEGDIVIYAPENHVNMFGQNTMWYRSFYDTEGMYNLFRYIDISSYPSVFTAFSTYNKERRFVRGPESYELIASGTSRSDKYGDFQQAERNGYRSEGLVKYIDSYFITLNKYYKNDLDWNKVDYQTENKDYNTSPTWTDITIYKDEVNRVIALLRATGAKVYFGFAPVDADDVVPEAQNREWMQAYDRLILDNYDFDGLLGSSADYVFNHEYFFDCAYHVNNYGRTYRTYQVYVDLCKILGVTDVKNVDGAGTDYNGCLFEDGTTDNKPLYTVDYLN